MDSMMDKLSKEIHEEDIIIRVRPFSNDDGKWSGEVDISIMAMPDNPLDDEDYHQVMHFSKMMCAAVPVMEEVEELRNIVHEYVIKVIDKEMDIEVELEDAGKEAYSGHTVDGNVIHLHFNTNTKGSA
jgi:Na+-transporting NADH:ubiquinone oxidoreductase subunit NqrA|tara:strand:+ start:696 stop:1079 length:384 start_codon:yes stop_codon:yes gene_type:complete